jgi:hypothetical protein
VLLNQHKSCQNEPVVVLALGPSCQSAVATGSSTPNNTALVGLFRIQLQPDESNAPARHRPQGSQSATTAAAQGVWQGARAVALRFPLPGKETLIPVPIPAQAAPLLRSLLHPRAVSHPPNPNAHPTPIPRNKSQGRDANRQFPEPPIRETPHPNGTF